MPNSTPTPPRSFARTEQIITTMTPAQRDRLDRWAQENELSRAAAVHRFVLEGLDRADAETAVTP